MGCGCLVMLALLITINLIHKINVHFDAYHISEENTTMPTNCWKHVTDCARNKSSQLGLI